MIKAISLLKNKNFIFIAIILALCLTVYIFKINLQKKTAEVYKCEESLENVKSQIDYLKATLTNYSIKNKAIVENYKKNISDLENYITTLKQDYNKKEDYYLNIIKTYETKQSELSKLIEGCKKDELKQSYIDNITTKLNSLYKNKD